MTENMPDAAWRSIWQSEGAGGRTEGQSMEGVGQVAFELRGGRMQ
jgi:hypothetical protein